MTSATFDIGRFPILKTWPEVDGGKYPVKAFASEVIEFGATATREGHDQLGVDLVLTTPLGEVIRKNMKPGSMGSDSWLIKHQLDQVGVWNYQAGRTGQNRQNHSVQAISYYQLGIAKLVYFICHKAGTDILFQSGTTGMGIGYRDWFATSCQRTI